ncbi:MAG: nucleotidyltransferase domain-containing protein [Euryarchaeota archaeon]|nr:nucleotidyltransferase domain-containing protein [Euryarchaeota archaeon]
MSPPASSRPGSPEPWRVAVAEFQREVREMYGPRLRAVVLYGSRARGDAEEGSDIDVMVVLRDFRDFWRELNRMGRAASEISLRHNVVITVLPVREREYRTRQIPLLMNVRREGVLLHEA